MAIEADTLKKEIDSQLEENAKQLKKFGEKFGGFTEGLALKKRVLDAGFYVARIHDDTFSLESPEGFQARCF